MKLPVKLDDVALFRQLPALNRVVPWARLGDWPTPVEPMTALREQLGGPPLWVKREDRSSTIYGGNKVRTLEAMMGQARAGGAHRIWATGAYGSNHSVATMLHAGAAGLAAGMALFPQPRSQTGVENLRAGLSVEPAVVEIASPLTLPLAMRKLRRGGDFVMAPGGATPEGTFGALSAALELAEQVERGDCPAPARIVVATGSTCTTAGLLVGLNLAARLGVGFGDGRAPLPRVHAVRVTPWPVTSTALVLQLAYRSSRLLARLVPDIAAIGLAELRRMLIIDRRQFGGGYGLTTARGWRAIQQFADCDGPPLDVVYSGKSAAAFIELARTGARGPLLFWATKSSAPLPDATAEQIAAAPPRMRRWLAGP